MVNFDARLVASGVDLYDLCKVVMWKVFELKMDIKYCMTEFKTSNKHTNNVIVALYGQISQNEQILGAGIDGLQATIGTQLQEMIDHFQMGGSS